MSLRGVSQRRALESQVLELMGQNASTRVALDQALAELQDAQQRLDELEAYREEAERELALQQHLKAYTTDLELRLKYMEKLVDEQRASMVRQRVDLTEAERARDDLAENGREASIEALSLQARVVELERCTAAARADCASLQAAYSAERCALEADLMEATAENRALRVQVGDVEGHNAALVDDLDAVRDEVQTQQRARGELVAEIGGYRELDKQVAENTLDLATLRTDNARLLKLLRSTAEWAEFQDLWNDAQGAAYVPAGPPGSEEAAGLGPALTQSDRFAEWFGVEELTKRCAADLDPVPAAAKHPEAAAAAATATAYGAGGSRLSKEAEGWVPHGAWFAGRDFRAQHLPGVPMRLIHTFLRDVNKAFLAREAAHVERIRLKFKAEFEDYVRRTNNDRSYDQVRASWEIRRLRRGVADLRAQGLGVDRNQAIQQQGKKKPARTGSQAHGRSPAAACAGKGGGRRARGESHAGAGVRLHKADFTAEMPDLVEMARATETSLLRAFFGAANELSRELTRERQLRVRAARPEASPTEGRTGLAAKGFTGPIASLRS